MIGNITEEERTFFETMVHLISCAEILFNDFDSLGGYDKDNFGKIRNYQYPMLGYDSLFLECNFKDYNCLEKLIEYFKLGGRTRVLNPNHKYYNIDRKAEKIQTNSLRFEGGSWIYFKEIKPINIFRSGFKIDNLEGGFIDYIFIDRDIIDKLEN
jgi:hypothetical protein